MRSSSKPIRIPQPERSSLAARAIAGLILTVGMTGAIGVVGLLGASPALALDDEVAERAANEQKSTTIEWRSTGIAHIELPLGFRARFDATATRNLYHSEDLAEAFITAGPQLRYRRSLESRISLSRALAQNVEFEIAWGARSPIENVNLLNFQRQTVGALLRIVH